MINSRAYREFNNYVLPDDSDLLDKAIEWIQKNISPEDVFDEKDLKNWALENGFVEDEIDQTVNVQIRLQ